MILKRQIEIRKSKATWEMDAFPNQKTLQILLCGGKLWWVGR